MSVQDDLIMDGTMQSKTMFSMRLLLHPLEFNSEEELWSIMNHNEKIRLLKRGLLLLPAVVTSYIV
jgi:hypothetical protein